MWISNGDSRPMHVSKSIVLETRIDDFSLIKKNNRQPLGSAAIRSWPLCEHKPSTSADPGFPAGENNSPRRLITYS